MAVDESASFPCRARRFARGADKVELKLGEQIFVRNANMNVRDRSTTSTARARGRRVERFGQALGVLATALR